MENNNHCGCGHDHHHHGEEEYPTIKLTLDDDRELECIVLEIFKVEQQEYIALLPNGEEQALLYRFNEEEEAEGPQLENIENDEEFNIVSEVFLELMENNHVEEGEILE